MADSDGRTHWGLAWKLRAHFKQHRAGRVYRMGRCEVCGAPYGYTLEGETALVFRETCECYENGYRVARASITHSWLDLAYELRNKKQELAMLFDYDLDLVDLEDGLEG